MEFFFFLLSIDLTNSTSNLKPPIRNVNLTFLAIDYLHQYWKSTSIRNKYGPALPTPIRLKADFRSRRLQSEQQKWGRNRLKPDLRSRLSSSIENLQKGPKQKAQSHYSVSYLVFLNRNNIKPGQQMTRGVLAQNRAKQKNQGYYFISDLLVFVEKNYRRRPRKKQRYYFIIEFWLIQVFHLSTKRLPFFCLFQVKLNKVWYLATIN